MGLLAAAPVVPSVGDTLTSAAGQLATTGYEIFGDVLPYGIALLGLAWGWSLVKGNLGFKKKKPV